VARVRFALVLVLGFIPVKSVLAEPAETENWIGLASVAVALAFSVFFLSLARRSDPPRWLPLATSQFDIAILSMGSLAFVLTGNPVTATNSLVHYTVYFLALAGSCRFSRGRGNPRRARRHCRPASLHGQAQWTQSCGSRRCRCVGRERGRRGQRVATAA